MQAQDAERYLDALDQALVEQGIQTPIPVLLMGGIYIMFQVNIRRTTDDIDVFPLVGSELDQATGTPLAVALYLATQTVAQNYQLSSDWFNTIRLAAIQPVGMNMQRTLWKKFQVLEVYLPEAEYILVQKLMIHRTKDHQDILDLFHKLGITTRAQAQALVDSYMNVKEQRKWKISSILDDYFPGSFCKGGSLYGHPTKCYAHNGLSL